MATQPKKVLYVITKSNWGGAQRYVFDMATNISKEGYDVEVVVGGDGVLVEKLHSAGIPVVSLSGLGRDINITKDFSVFFALIKLFRQKKPDIVHLNSSKIGAIGAMAARYARVPTIIFTAHGWAFNEDRNFLSKVFIKCISWFTVIACDKTITVSNYMKSQTAHWPFIKDKIIVIHNGVAETKCLSIQTARLELARIFSNTFPLGKYSDPATVWIGTIAELHHTKSHETAIRSIRMLMNNANGKTFMYAIIGDGDERSRLEKLIIELGLERNVFLLGHVDNAAQYLKAFDIFVLASLSEGLGYVILEAGLVGIPCIATNVGGIPEIIENMVSGILVQPRQPEEITKAINYFVGNKNIREKCAMALQKKVSTEFTIRGMVQATVVTYQ